MDRTALRQALLEMLESNRGAPVERFDEDMSLQTDLGLDSIDMVALVLEIQDRFQLSLALPELKHVRRVSELLDLLQAKLSARQAA